MRTTPLLLLLLLLLLLVVVVVSWPLLELRVDFPGNS
jgi:hypothetical protein